MFSFFFFLFLSPLTTSRISITISIFRYGLYYISISFTQFKVISAKQGNLMIFWMLFIYILLCCFSYCIRLILSITLYCSSNGIGAWITNRFVIQFSFAACWVRSFVECQFYWFSPILITLTAYYYIRLCFTKHKPKNFQSQIELRDAGQRYGAGGAEET